MQLSTAALEAVLLASIWTVSEILTSGGRDRWADALDEVDVTIAERRPLDALQALRRIEKMMVSQPPSPEADPLHVGRISQGA
jgi:hypothetical protein